MTCLVRAGELARTVALRHQANYSMCPLTYILGVYQVYGHICLRYDVQCKHIYVTLTRQTNLTDGGHSLFIECVKICLS